MDNINTKMLGDETIYPDDAVLKGVLDEAYISYEKLLELFDTMALTHEWRYYHDGKSWLCKVQHKKRTIVWMSAWKGFMNATVYFPLSRLDLVMNLDLKEETKEGIQAAKNIGKSKPCTFEVRSVESLVDLQKVMELKILTK